MEDVVKKEIDKIGKVIEAILLKIGIIKNENRKDDFIDLAKSELLDELDIDLDQLLQNDMFVEILIQKYGFTDRNLEKFAELLFDFIKTENSVEVKNKLISSIGKICVKLERSSHSISFMTVFILKELKKYLD
jgi:hypothetical protein